MQPSSPSATRSASPIANGACGELRVGLGAAAAREADRGRPVARRGELHHLGSSPVSRGDMSTKFGRQRR